MTILPSLRDRGRVIRRVDITDAQAVQVVDEPEDWFSMSVTKPANPPGGPGSPRDAPATVLRWAGGGRSPAGRPLLSSDRVEGGDGTVWELLRPSRALRAARREIGWTAPAQEFGVLYPLVAQVLAQGGVDVLAENVPAAVFTPRKTQEDRGEFVDVAGECPIEFLAPLSNQNCWFQVGGVKYRVTECLPDLTGPRVRLVLRGIGG